MTKKQIIILFLFLIIKVKVNAQFKFYFNQLGFYEKGPKQVAVTFTSNDIIEKVPLDEPGLFLPAKKQLENVLKVIDINTSKVVYKVFADEVKSNPFSQKLSQIIDFSEFNTPGKYYFTFNKAKSKPFEIKGNQTLKAAKASLKSYYFQRVSMPLLPKYAGAYARPAGHPDDKVYIHASAASANRPENTVINSSRGWYDAGDYNKYIVNSGISQGTMYLLYENFPDFCSKVNVNIPESGNGVPDLLNENLWNLRWMLTMQDPTDGGVYHKCTNAEFDKMDVMPHKAMAEKRYVIYKTSTAALDFCAVMAQASRIYRQYESNFPGLADSCLNASKNAWTWAKANPNTIPNQNKLNQQFKPAINTGAYDNIDDTDKWAWASAELYATTGDENYYPAQLIPSKKPGVQVWRSLHRMAYYTFLNQEIQLGKRAQNDLDLVKKEVIAFADELLEGVGQQPFGTVMGKTESDFMWGSSGHAANQGIALLQAYKITKNKKYLNGALTNLDYLYGRNATGYCFLTGFGTKQVMNPHHRPSFSDGIVAPIPGLLSGGTNPKRQDKCPGYTTTVVDEHFLDNTCSYSTNENCINWNAAMVYLSWALEALQNEF